MARVRGRPFLLLPIAALAVGCGSTHKRAAPSTSVTPPPPAVQSTPFKATFRALQHRPKVNTPWRYVVGATPSDRNGAPITSVLHVRVRVRGVWLDFGSNSFTGVYQDEISWPPSARGKLLVFEATVSQGKRLKTFRFRLRPR
jgi:hypothetical protein